MTAVATAQPAGSSDIPARRLLPVLLDEDNKIVRSMQLVGIPRVAAAVLVAMDRYAGNEPVDTRWLEWVAYLRQPEVSKATQWLISEKVLDFRIAERAIKGRPLHTYWISRVLGCYIQDKIDQQRNEFAASVADLQNHWPDVH